MSARKKCRYQVTNHEILSRILCTHDQENEAKMEVQSFVPISVQVHFPQSEWISFYKISLKINIHAY